MILYIYIYKNYLIKLDIQNEDGRNSQEPFRSGFGRSYGIEHKYVDRVFSRHSLRVFLLLGSRLPQMRFWGLRADLTCSFTK